MKYRSSCSKEELIKRWDDVTSPARFAGANAELDWVYNASRKEDRVRLVKKPRASYDPYATVFRGKIEEDGEGSSITGIYTKGIADYIITLIVGSIYFGVCAEYASRSAVKTVPYLLISAGILVVLFLLTPLPGKRRKYGELIKKVTGETDDRPSDGGSDPGREKYKFRIRSKH